MAFDLQAHRGGRGLAPESRMAAFRNAVALGVTTIETDLAVTRDNVLVLSHEPRLNPDLTRGADGKWLTSPGRLIHDLTLAELKRYDIGRLNPDTKYGAQFPGQKPSDGERFPTLAELFAMAGPDMRFNIETKIDPTRPDDTVTTAAFAKLVVDAVHAARMERRATIQSFDWRTLVGARRLAPDIETVCLTIESPNMNSVVPKPSPWLAGFDVNQGGSLLRQAKAAGCATWSPFWRNVTTANVAEAHELGLKVIPWTVNNPSDMAGLIDLKVDGLITDYPDRGMDVLAKRGLKAR
jgi:glycerophosphoryl diester phosphodiesterase